MKYYYFVRIFNEKGEKVYEKCHVYTEEVGCRALRMDYKTSLEEGEKLEVEFCEKVDVEKLTCEVEEY